MVELEPAPGVAAIVGNRWSRVGFVTGDEVAYGIAETWNGRAWRRVGTMWPLAHTLTQDEEGQTSIDEPRFTKAPPGGRRVLWREPGFAEARVEEGKLILEEADEWGYRWRITAWAEKNAPRIHLRHEFSADHGAHVTGFSGPGLLAGEGAYGAHKDFAIFPGLEYLEGDEESSSTRDLVPPLNDRRLPAPYKIAAPVMAVQSQGTLAALLWDANQEWAEAETHPGAYFASPKQGSGQAHTEMGLLAPSVGEYLEENSGEPKRPYELKPGETLRLEAQLVLDHITRYPKGHMVHGSHRGALVLQAMQQYFDAYGLPEPSPQPRAWEEERAVSREAYLKTAWREEPPGWFSHTAAEHETNLRLTPVLLHEMAQGVDAEADRELRRRVDLVTEAAMAEDGPGALLSSNRFFLPLFLGHVPEGLKQYRGRALGTMGARENGLWVWRTNSRKHRTLGIPGTHTLGQAAFPSLCALWAARYTGDPEVAGQALEAMKQMELYEVPRGSSMWECPQYQPDLLAAALAVKAYVEAYRITGDETHIEHARYWAWTGLPFLYLWEMDGTPTMRYNSIGVIGSTFFTHSWIGRPVVWMGLDYAIALEELAEYDHSLPWTRIAQGITNSAMWQQHAEGEFKGLFPDSWEMADNTPNPSHINPLPILHSEYRLRGMSPHVRCHRIDQPGGPVFINAAADIERVKGTPRQGRLSFTLKGLPGLTTHSIIAQVHEPEGVSLGKRAADSEALLGMGSGWLYDSELKALVLKHSMPEQGVGIEVTW